MVDPVIQAAGLVKRYGELEAVRGIDLEVQTGEIFGFLGPNGAGKSTTISILCTLLRPTAGTARVAGIDVVILLVLAPFVGVKLSVATVLAMIPLAAVLAFGLSAFGVAIASTMKSLQGFQVVMNFLMMPMFFLSGALFPLNNLPGWMTVLTRLDPASYGIDPLRRVVLSGSGLPSAVIDRLGLTINGNVLPIPLEAGIMLAFGAVMLAIAVVRSQRRD